MSPARESTASIAIVDGELDQRFDEIDVGTTALARRWIEKRRKEEALSLAPQAIDRIGHVAKCSPGPSLAEVLRSIDVPRSHDSG